MSVDISDTGIVERVMAVAPPVWSGAVKIQAILTDASGKQSEVVEPPRSLDPLFAEAAEASVQQMRFSPAEIDGKPISFAGMRMTLVFSDPQPSHPV